MMYIYSDDPLKWQSLCSFTSGRLKNTRDVDKWPTLSFYLSVRRMSVTGVLGLYLVQFGWINSALNKY